MIKLSQYAALLLAAGLPLGLAVASSTQGNEERKLLELNPKDFDERSTVVDNPWLPLTPGTRLVYEGFHVEDGKQVPHRIVDTITDVTKVINGVRVIVSLEDDYSDGRLVEQEIRFHAQDKKGNVWHLGQLREMYDENELVGGRAWFVGDSLGSKAGVRMLAKPKVKDTYSQGYAPDPFNWTDRARVYKSGQKVSVKAGKYGNVLVIEEWDQETPKGVFQLKYYAQGIGAVQIGFRGPDPEEEEMELIKVEKLSPAELAKEAARAMAVDARAYMYNGTSRAERMPAR